MTEAFLHYIWKYRLFNTQELSTTTGESLSIMQPGTHNFNGGPDFLNARIKIGPTTWAGHIEIHTRASDWHHHKHTDDAHYKNVVLHVVFDNDKEIFLHNAGDLQVLDLSTYMRTDQWAKYEGWLQSKTWIACQGSISQVDSLTWTGWKDRLLIERLEHKSKLVNAQLEKTKGDWSETFYRLLARNFGFKVNADAMEMLAESVPQSILAKHKSDPFQIEALLFGQAGFLNEIFTDEYPIDLKKEYDFLQKKYGMSTMNSAFPTIRIAQLAALICKSEHLFSTLVELESTAEIKRLFQVEAHEYWNHHFRFDAKTVGKDLKTERNAKRLGVSSLENLLINTVAVVLFTYGKHRDDENYIDKALKLLELCEPDFNRIVNNWNDLGIKSATAADSQSMIQLYNNYCTDKLCLQCAVGLKLMNK
jgi:Protein of unknown function (DUF2851)